MEKVKPRRAPDQARVGGVYIDGVNITQKARKEKEQKAKQATKKEVNKNVATS